MLRELHTHNQRLIFVNCFALVDGDAIFCSISDRLRIRLFRWGNATTQSCQSYGPKHFHFWLTNEHRAITKFQFTKMILAFLRAQPNRAKRKRDQNTIRWRTH